MRLSETVATAVKTPNTMAAKRSEEHDSRMGRAVTQDPVAASVETQWPTPD